jgi:hypothetical protein
MKRGLIPLLLVAAAVLVPQATAANPAGLGGEQFTATQTTILSCGVGDFGGTFRYTTTGTATGPYAGTFSETGTVTVGPSDQFGRHAVTAVAIAFSIDSSAGQVTGTHQFAYTPGNPATATCEYGWNGVSGSAGIFQNALRYTASIATPAGAACTATGTSLLRFTQGSSVIADSFSSAFYNDPGSPVCTVADTTPPVLTVPAKLVVDATSPAGAVVTYAVSAVDDVGVAPVVTCAPASGTTFAIGATTVTCTAADAAGNVSAPAAFTVTVRGAVEQVQTALTTSFNGLAAKQRAILADLGAGRVAAACNVLGAYANQVDALAATGRIAPADADALRAAVARIRAVLAC